MVTGAFVTQRPVDHDEIRRRPLRHDLAGRGHADQKAAARDEQLLGQQHGKRRADGAADDAAPLCALLELVELGVIAGPGWRHRGPPFPPQHPQDVAVRVEHADLRNIGQRQTLLPACFPQ